VDVFERVHAFLSASNQGEGRDSLPLLLRVREALSSIHAELARDPARAPDAGALLGELSAEYERLLRDVGAEALRRALDVKAEPPPVESQLPAPAQPSVNDEPAPSPASDDEIRSWADRYRSGERASSIQPSPLPAAALVLGGLLDQMGPPPEGAMAPPERTQELERLQQAVSEDALRALRQVPNDEQRTYLRLVTARLNALREAPDRDVLSRERVRRLLSAIRDYTAEHRPGTVHGLASAHEPKAGSWQADAAHLWRLLAGDEQRPEPRSRPAAAKRRRRLDDELDDEDRGVAHAPPDEWPLWSSVRDRTVLMVGGNPREDARERVQRTFGMRSLEWIADEPRKAQSAEARIAAAGYDLVLVLLRFVSHTTAERLARACNASQVAYAAVEHGYGVAAVRRSLEQFLLPRAAAAR